MPFVRVTKSNAWDLWREGLIAGINATNKEPEPRIVNLAINKGMNAIRLFLTDAEANFSLVVRDYIAIGASYAANPTGSEVGWNLPDLTVSAVESAQPFDMTIARVADSLTEFFDRCSQLGVGVILTVPFWAQAGGRMWVAQAGNAAEGASGTPNATTPADVQTAAVNFWRATAAKWGSHPAVVGYDIVNEPDPATDTDWTALARRIVTGIRAIDNATPIIVEGADNGSSDGIGVFNVTSDTNGQYLLTNFESLKIVFSFHAYAPALLTHGGLAEWAYEQMGGTYPVTGSVVAYSSNGTARLESVENATQLYNVYYTTAILFKFEKKVPMFVGEFSYIDQTGDAGGGFTDRFYQPEETAYCRQVTAITVGTNQVTLVMGNIQSGVTFDGGRVEYGFRIDSDARVPGTTTSASAIKLADINNPATGMSNTVRVSLLKVGHDTASRTEVPDTPEFQTVVDAVRADNGASLDYAAFDAVIDALNISGVEVTIRRSQNEYVISFPGGVPNGVTSIARQAAVMNGSNVVRYPAVGVVSLAPSAANQALQAASREAYTRHSLDLWWSTSVSWAWHSVSADLGRTWWRPSPAIFELLRQSAMARYVTSA